MCVCINERRKSFYFNIRVERTSLCDFSRLMYQKFGTPTNVEKMKQHLYLLKLLVNFWLTTFLPSIIILLLPLSPNSLSFSLSLCEMMMREWAMGPKKAHTYQKKCVMNNQSWRKGEVNITNQTEKERKMKGLCFGQKPRREKERSEDLIHKLKGSKMETFFE